MDEVLEKLIKVFDDNGIIVLDDELDLPIEVDSIQFISIVVQLEDVFGIEIPDEFLLTSRLSSFHDFEFLIKTLIQ